MAALLVAPAMSSRRPSAVPPTPTGGGTVQTSREGPPTKFLLVTGGNVSGLGKGTATSSMGVVLRSHGVGVTAIKIDPYLNVDSGNTSPFERGEVFVLEDGGQVDLDLGHYERVLDVTLTSSHNITSGKIFEHVIKLERSGHFLGKNVQMVPHVTDAIQDWIVEVARSPVAKSGKRPEVCLIELGGTVGDIENAVYLEALQQLMFKIGTENFCVAHISMVPVMGATGEQKTKPCQHSVRQLRGAGLRPDLLLCRSEQPLEGMTRQKLSLSCQVPAERVISLHDISNIYRIPLLLADQDVGIHLCRHLCIAKEATVAPTLQLTGDVVVALGTEARDQRLGHWRVLADRMDTCSDEVVIAIVSKYTGLPDSYISVIKALQHACLEAGLHLSIEWVDASDLEPNAQSMDHRRYDGAWFRLRSAHGILAPGSMGDRGIEGKVLAAAYSRSSNTPYLGIDLGFQAAVIEFGRAELGWDGANSVEFDEATPHPLLVVMPEASTSIAGGTMRLGSRATLVTPGSLAHRIYGGKSMIYERHRRRYEVNTTFVPALEAKGLRFSGHDDRGQRQEICELGDHPYHLSCQFLPELQSRPAHPSPPVLGLVLAAAKRLERRLEEDGGSLRPGAGFGRRC